MVFGIGHLAGGTVPVGQGTLYQWWLVDGLLRYDNLQHTWGFAFVGLATWEALRHRLGPTREDAGFVAAWVVGLAAVAFGAINEIVEFVLTLTLSATNVGGYDNTARDIVANLVGGALMAAWTTRGLRSPVARAGPVRHGRQTPPSHVVVVGGGFAGTRAVERLSRPDASGIKVTLVDRTNHHTFAPLLYQVATAALSPQDVARSLRAMNTGRDNVSVRHGAVEAVDLAAREVRLHGGSHISYDHLVLAPGSVTADFGVPGVSQHAFPLKSVGDAVAIRNHVLDRFEVAGGSGNEGELTFAVAGGGATGVEVAGAMAELRDVLLRRDYVELTGRQVRVVLIERLDTLLPDFAESSRQYTRRVLERAGVEVILGTGIARVLQDGLELDDGTMLPARTVIWAAGVRANPLVAALGVATDRSSRVAVNADLSLPGHPEVSVVGDAAALCNSRGDPIPQVAPAAMQQGRHAAEQILRHLSGRSTEPFRYCHKGSMATIGRNTAVNEYPIGLRLRGFPAWVAWLVLHLLSLSGFRNRLSALLTWGWSYLTFDRSLRAVFDTPVRAPARPSAAGREPTASRDSTSR